MAIDRSEVNRALAIKAECHSDDHAVAVAYQSPSKPDPARALVQKFAGPLATTYSCPFCNYRETFKSGGRHAELWGLRNGRSNGRGYGLAMGGALHSKMAAHIRAAHAEKLKSAE